MRLAARAVAIAGVAAVAWLLLGRGPKDVTVVYDVSTIPGARALEVEVARGGEVLRRSEFRLGGPGGGRVEQKLRLPEGEYVLRGRVDAPGGAAAFEKPLEVREADTVVLPLGR